MNTAANPLATGNRLQRAYFRWALPHYERIGAKDPELRQHIEEVDVLLYTRKGVWAWLGWFLGCLGCGLGLRAAGMALAPALGLALLIQIGFGFAILSTWLGARQRDDGKRRRIGLGRAVIGFGVGALAGMAGLVAGSRMARGHVHLSDVTELFTRVAPGLILLLLGMVVVLTGIWKQSQSSYQRRLERSRLQQERDAATARALEADLRLLQAQIHPHFVFNTLATLQHWVDKGDKRAGPLLRELTGFLRRSTEMLGRTQVPLAEELQAVRHYLAILGQRMPSRLAWTVDMDAGLAEHPVPPGLVLTLVENAIEHGLEPKIGGGRVAVTAETQPSGWCLRVSDDGLGLAPGSEDGVGLGNVRRRLQLQHGDAARLQLRRQPDGGTLAEVSFA